MTIAGLTRSGAATEGRFRTVLRSAAMIQFKRVAFIGNSLPRRCGIATFTTDLHNAVQSSGAQIEPCIVAMNDDRRAYDYPPQVKFQIRDDLLGDYTQAADFLNAQKYDVVCLQHEFGIFGGDAGAHVLALLTRLDMPVVTTFHTVLARPTPAQYDVLRQIAELSSIVVVMAEKARELLRSVYDVAAEKIEVIAHGIPDFPFVEPDLAKVKLGFTAKPVILTFGLLSPNKGIEVVIDAMPLILKSRPDAVYVVLGATHPNLVRQEGEAYRESLIARALKLGVHDHVVFLDQFVDQATLLEFISMCDVYVTPYFNEAQMTSGTLAYSFGLGKAVVSTPYWHARELLADGRGVLVPFHDSVAIGNEIAGLLTDGARRQAMRIRAYSDSRSMTWKRVAERYHAVFARARRNHRLNVIANLDKRIPVRSNDAPPDMQIGHLLSMCDDTGLFQHAIHSIPDRAHGYCIDDNARALLLACALNAAGEEALGEVLTARLVAFIQHAWNPATRRFRNFMSFGRVWLEESGSEDSHGRTLWALGECARSDISPSRRQWATDLFNAALPAAESFCSPRAWAFCLLGLDAYCSIVKGNALAARLRLLLADRLISMLESVETEDWIWFEEGLAYDNARLPQALILTGIATGTPVFTKAGLRSLRWLMTRQTAASGYFRPVGTQGFGDKRAAPRLFDQQPLEATATISACLAAWQTDGDPKWKSEAQQVFSWFLGHNDLAQPLIDLETGSCCDGLHPDRVNQNKGGESVVSYLLSLAEIRLAHRLGESRAKFPPRLAPAFARIDHDQEAICRKFSS
jgi:glycosyltransferase involved in cell wall biosynthesis